MLIKFEKLTIFSEAQHLTVFFILLSLSISRTFRTYKYLKQNVPDKASLRNLGPVRGSIESTTLGWLMQHSAYWAKQASHCGKRATKSTNKCIFVNRHIFQYFTLIGFTKGFKIPTTASICESLIPSLTVSLLSVKSIVPFTVLPHGRINLLYEVSWNFAREILKVDP